jgi:hypothetical protein
VSTATLPPPAAVPPRAPAASAFGIREYALTALSLGALAWLLPPAHLALYAVTAAAVYGVAATGLSRNAKLGLVVAVLAGFLALKNAYPRPGLPFEDDDRVILWGGFGIEVFFVLRAIDFAVSPYGKLLAPRPLDRAVQFLLYLFFLPTLFSGPSVTFGDFYKAYAPASGRRGWDLWRNLGLVGWGAAKFYAFYEPLRTASNQLLTWGMAGGAPSAALDGPLALWLYVAVWMVAFYVAFSGFCDMAVGVSRLLGFRLYDNFEAPFFARDPADYWKRWNVSGRKWLIKHVFYPYWDHDRITLKIMTTFWASGLWHFAVAARVNAAAAVQLFAALTIYGAAVAVATWAEGRPGLQALDARLGRGGRGAVRAGMIAFTFLFTALIHQVFWNGMFGRPLADTAGLLRGLFGLG